MEEIWFNFDVTYKKADDVSFFCVKTVLVAGFGIFLSRSFRIFLFLHSLKGKM